MEYYTFIKIPVSSFSEDFTVNCFDGDGNHFVYVGEVIDIDHANRIIKIMFARVSRGEFKLDDEWSFMGNISGITPAL